MELRLISLKEADLYCWVSGCTNFLYRFRLKPWGAVGVCRKHYKEEAEIEKIAPTSKIVCLWTPKRRKGRSAKLLSNSRR